MDSARLNVYWFLSLLAPAAIMCAAALARRKWVSLCALPISIAVTYWLCLLAVTRKWQTYLSRATTDAERQWVFDHDGGNQAFTAVVTGPLEAVLYSVIWGVIGWKLSARSRNVVV
jgi:hypothetical protein